MKKESGIKKNGERQEGCKREMRREESVKNVGKPPPQKEKEDEERHWHVSRQRAKKDRPLPKGFIPTVRLEALTTLCMYTQVTDTAD